MYSGGAPPASPASTMATSPGARGRSRKLRMTMPSTSGTACSSRPATKRSRAIISDDGCGAASGRPASLVEIGAREVAVDAERRRDQVFVGLVEHGREGELVGPDQWRGVDHELLELVVLVGGFLGVALDRAEIHQLVGARRRPAAAVHEHGALADHGRMVLAVHAEYRIGQVEEKVRGE